MDPPLRELLSNDAVDVAPRLLGWVFSTRVGGVSTSVQLTEVEAYMGVDDPASHAHRGETKRNGVMFGPSGHLYVYLSYGIHHCVNIVTGGEGEGQAVLLRGGIPVTGEDVMRGRRGRSTHLVDGPGNLGQALGLTIEHSGLPIDSDIIGLKPGNPPMGIVATPRIGISKATKRPWRFLVDG